LQQHFGVECSAHDLHKALMFRCRSKWGQYSSSKAIEDCAHAIEQVAGKLPTAGLPLLMHAICAATEAIPHLSGNAGTKCSFARHSTGIAYAGTGRNKRTLAHAMGGGGSYGDFCNPKFVQQWSHFIYFVLNMDPQLVFNEISNISFQTLICDYKRVEEGKVGTMYWEVTGAKTRAQVDIYSTTHMHLPYHADSFFLLGPGL
jgi:hypothetical protein